jgi:hypothetical protein
MTPQERQLISELFARLAALESSPRDPDAEAMIREGLRRAPNGVYSLVQTVLVQDEALKAANARIQDYEQQNGAPQQQDQPPRGFLDTMRDSLLGRDQPPQRGSVPRVPPAGAAPTRNDPWGGSPTQGYPQQQAPNYAQPPAQTAPSGGGSSFLGTAAAAAAGMIGGSLLMSGIRSAMGGHNAGPFNGAFDSLSGRGGGDRSPWGGNASNSDLARDAGLNDVGSSRGGDTGGSQRAGLFGSSNDDDDNNDDSDFDDSDDGSDDDGGNDEA